MHSNLFLSNHIDFKKFKENNKGTYLPLDFNKQKRSLSKDSLDKIRKSLEQIRYSPSFGKLVLTFSNGNKVYALPQDNMACVVPDLSQFNMPVVGTKIKITGMPPGNKIPTPIIPQENK